MDYLKRLMRLRGLGESSSVTASGPEPQHLAQDRSQDELQDRSQDRPQALPHAADPGVGDQEAEDQEGAAALPGMDKTILVAENDENNRTLVEQILSFAGYRCVLATNGQEALDAFDRERFDLVLTDLSMPVLDGYRTAELIRARPGCETLPIVAVTAHAMGNDRELALRSGCTEYLSKPFRPNELLGLVERLLDGRAP
jgi:CheY-like chemotaxis protein